MNNENNNNEFSNNEFSNNEFNNNEFNHKEFNNNELSNIEIKNNEINNDQLNHFSNQSYSNSQQRYSTEYKQQATQGFTTGGEAYNQNQNPYTVYPTPSLKEEKQPKKKRRMIGVLKLTAAAVVFGIVAGASLQGYNMLVNSASSSKAEKASDDTSIKLSELLEDTKDEEIIVPTTAKGETVITDVSDVVDKVMPSIVAINSSGTAISYDFFGRQFSQPTQGSGSGIIIAQNSKELLLVTNNHVIEGAENVEIVFSDESTATATVKGADANADLAVLSVDIKGISEDTLKNIKVATIGNSDNVKPGEMAIAIGNALGYGQSVTVGYISAVNRELTIGNQTMTLLQTDAAINPGNSGGALLNTSGQVIGINSVKYASQEVEGMGYAIPISSAIPMINELMNREVIEKGEQGFLGIDASTAQNVTEIYAERFNMPVGVYVNDVLKDSPAEKAGLMQGDIITGLNDLKIKTIDDLINALSYKKAGDTIKLQIQVKENGKYVEKTLEVTLGEREDIK